MLIIRSNLLNVAVIDPLKKLGERGQYISYSGKENNLVKEILAARLAKKEIRYYYKDLMTKNGEVIPVKMIITEIPPKHVQPFHVHNNLHEITVVDKGKMIAVESEALQESDPEKLKNQGELLEEGDMVIEDPGVRHTHMNPNDEYSVTTTIQVARIPFEKFSSDWKR